MFESHMRLLAHVQVNTTTSLCKERIQRCGQKLSNTESDLLRVDKQLSSQGGMMKVRTTGREHLAVLVDD
jgi:hypothetical protein